MVSNIVWIPTSNVPAGGYYIYVIQVGTPPQPVIVILDSGGVTLSVTANNYWQVDALQNGSTAFLMYGMQAGLSILGLPLLNNYFAVFDQTGAGTIRFAMIAQPVGGVFPQPGAKASA